MNMEFNIGKNRIETTGQTHTLTTVPTVTFTAKHKHRQTNEPPHLQNNWEYEMKEYLRRSSITIKIYIFT